MTTAMDRCAVLFVDDEPLVLQGLQRMLRGERQNWAMRFARSGAEALQAMEKETFDAVVSDLRMPGMDGAELLTKVMDRHPHMVRIVLSGEMDRDLTFKTVHCAHQYLAKPCDADVQHSLVPNEVGNDGTCAGDRRGDVPNVREPGDDGTRARDSDVQDTLVTNEVRDKRPDARNRDTQAPCPNEVGDNGSGSGDRSSQLLDP